MGSNGAGKYLFPVTNAKIGYVLKMQNAPMACHNCGYRWYKSVPMKERRLALSRWTGHKSVMYCERCAEKLLIVFVSA